MLLKAWELDWTSQQWLDILGRCKGVNFTIGCLNQKTPFYEAVVKQLTARQKVKAIQTVRIKWEAKRHFIAELEKIVPEVQWDERRG